MGVVVPTSQLLGGLYWNEDLPKRLVLMLFDYTASRSTTDVSVGYLALLELVKLLLTCGVGATAVESSSGHS